ncbi:MAG: methionine adenosyltransferase domain-containing protein, partial [Verrucomicrobiota bacterium]
YYSRWVAKNVVAADLAERCELQVAYAIGHPEPVSVSVDTFGTNKVSDEVIEKAVREIFSFKPADIVNDLNLKRPIYHQTTNYGHFGREDQLDALTWEKKNRADDLRSAANA